MPATGEGAQPVSSVVSALYRSESRRIFATLIRLLGDFDLAEETLQEAFRAALEQWPHCGMPANPRAWLVRVGRFKGIDRIRRDARLEPLGENEARIGTLGAASDGPDPQTIEDGQLRLIFTCCHPALAPDAQTALTLREVCGLTTEQIAAGFLVPAPTLAQRIVRAKAKIRRARIPYQVPEPDALAPRLDGVLRVIYLVFNEGYSASSGDVVSRGEPSGEAIRLGRLLVALLPEPEAMGLLALMLLHESRRAARTSANGDLILLEDQSRELWDRDLIAEGVALVRRTLAMRRVGPYAIQAAIAATHAEASEPATTDWAQIVGLYDALVKIEPSSVIELNRAVALAMRDGPEAGLALIDALLADGTLQTYRLAHAARADLCRRLGRTEEAGAAYAAALALTRQAPERRFLERRLAALSGPV